MGITGKIVLPFTLLFGAVIAVSSWAAVRQATRGVEVRLERMTRDLAGISSEGGFLLSPPFLARIKSVFHAEAAAAAGEPARVEAATFPAERSPEVRGATQIAAAAAAGGLREGVRIGGREYVMAWSPVRARAGGPMGTLFLFFPAEEIRAEKTGAAVPPVAVGLIGAVLATVLGAAIAHSLTKPIRLLAAKTREIASGTLDPHIELGTHDELAELARAFESMARDLRARQEELIRAEQFATLGKVTARIAHEIRNPLAAMKLGAQMLLKEVPDERTRPDLERILAETERLQLTVEELLGAASPTDLQRAPCDVNQVVDDTLALLGRQIAHRNVRLERHREDLEPAELDRNRFKQVLLNLTLNALNAMPGGGTLGVRTARDPASAAAVVEISDSGPGIPETMGAKAFEPFVTSRAGGTGLGLPLSRAIVERHGGTLAYLRREGRTVFEIRLPASGGTSRPAAP